MKFKGLNFRLNRRVVGVMPRMTESPYVVFYRVDPNNRVPAVDDPHVHHALEGRKWSDTGEQVYGVEIAVNGHSLTNMAYGADDRVYLARDGQCYTAIMPQARKNNRK